MNSNHPQQLLRARQALKVGHKREARALLQQLLRAEPENAQAWLLLAAATSSPQASINYIARAEKLQPENPAIPRARAWAQKRLAETTAERMPAPTPESSSSPAPAPEAIRGPTRQQGSRRFRPLLLGVALVALFVIAGGSVRFWREATGGAPAETVTPQPLATSAIEELAGYFAPVSVADTGALPLSPTATRRSPGAIAAKPVTTRENGGARPTWTVTPSPTATPSPTPTVLPTFVSNNTAPQSVMRPAGVGPNERWIDVNLTTQQLVAYEGNTPVYDSLISSGTYNHPTVTGQFRIWLRFQSQTMDGRRLGYDYYLENVPYVMYFYRDYALHGTFWHNNFGTPMSHGCVNLPTPAAEWIFNWSEMGTLVSVHY